MTDKANEKEIRSYLDDYAKDIIIETVNEITSTNDEMKLRAADGEKGGVYGRRRHSPQADAEILRESI